MRARVRTWFLQRRECLEEIGAFLFLFLLFHLLFIALSGKGFSDSNNYNSYSKQCAAWLQGRLDLGRDYPWLELAVYQGKYYVSFPPFPSYVLLPFAVFCGENTPDLLLALLSASLGGAYGVRIARCFGLRRWSVILLPFFLYCGTAVWQVTVDGWVWFFAQNLALTLTLMSLFYALAGKRGRAAFFLCCAVGCRPFQALYAPLILLLLFSSTAGKSAGARVKNLLLKKFRVWIPACLLMGSYLLLNFLRFDNPLEFGHNHLPEFTNSEYGQFSLRYVGENFKNLFRLPTVDPETRRLVFPLYDGMNLFLSFPILLWYVWLLWRCRKGLRSTVRGVQGMVLCLTALHIFCLLLHKTMGGFHYGNRYIIDTLAPFYLAICALSGTRGEDAPWAERLLFLLLLAGGIVLSMTGVLQMYGANGA